MRKKIKKSFRKKLLEKDYEDNSVFNGRQSLNKKIGLKLLNEATELVIVGTATPYEYLDHNQQAFYYCGKHNRVFGILEEYFSKNDNFSKGFLISRKNNLSLESINELIDFFKNHNIAFLDIIDKFNVYDEKDHSDNNINRFILDFDSFKYINKNATIIATSEDAYLGLLIISNKLNGKLFNINYCSQFYLQSEIKQKWIKFIDEALIK